MRPIMHKFVTLLSSKDYIVAYVYDDHICLNIIRMSFIAYHVPCRYCLECIYMYDITPLVLSFYHNLPYMHIMKIIFV